MCYDEIIKAYNMHMNNIIKQNIKYLKVVPKSINDYEKEDLEDGS